MDSLNCLSLCLGLFPFYQITVCSYIFSGAYCVRSKCLNTYRLVFNITSPHSLDYTALLKRMLCMYVYVCMCTCVYSTCGYIIFWCAFRTYSFLCQEYPKRFRKISFRFEVSVFLLFPVLDKHSIFPVQLVKPPLGNFFIVLQIISFRLYYSLPWLHGCVISSSLYRD
jgi:hypothetical protein